MLSAIEWAYVIGRDKKSPPLLPGDDIVWLAQYIADVQQTTIDWCVDIIRTKADQLAKQQGSSTEAALIVNGAALTLLLANSDRLREN